MGIHNFMCPSRSDASHSSSFATRNEVDRANKKRLQEIDGEVSEYTAFDEGGRDDQGRPITREKIAQFLDRVMAPETLFLKVMQRLSSAMR